MTGGTRGIGRALAAAILAEGSDVLVTGRDGTAAAEAAESLNSAAAAGARARAHACACDVGDAASVEALGVAALQAFGAPPAAWVCNAGTNGYVYADLVDMDAATVAAVVAANSVGTLLCAREALRGGAAHVFLMEGAGSGGEPTRKYAAYGYSKAGYRQLISSLNSELKASGSSQKVHALSPGLVRTEMTSPGDDAFGSTGRFFVNAVAEEPEDVAAYLAPRVVRVARGGDMSELEGALVADGRLPSAPAFCLSRHAADDPSSRESHTLIPHPLNPTAGENSLSRAAASARGHERIEFLTPPRLLAKVARRLALGENKDRYSPEDDAEFEAARKRESE